MEAKNKKIVDGHAKGSKRILMIGAYKPQIDGVSHVVQNLVKILKTTHKLYVINMEDVRRPVGLGHWKDGSIDVYQEKMWYSKKFKLIQTLFQTTKRAWLLRKKVDIYHTHAPFYSGIGLLDKKKPLVLTMHGYSTLETVAFGRIKPDSLGFRFIRWMERKAVARADAVIAVDSTIAEWCKTDLACDPDKLFTITNGVDTSAFDPRRIESDAQKLREKYGLKKHNRLLVCIRRSDPKNGVQNVLDGFIAYCSKNPDDKDSILFLGGGGSLKDSLIQIIKEKGMEKRVIIEDTIPHKDIPVYYGAADIILNSFTHLPFVKEFAVNSVREGLEEGRPICTSLTTVEALSMGRPVILSTVGGDYHGVDFNDLGVITSDKNPDEVADAIKILLSNYEKALEMGKRAREYIVKNRDWEIIAKKVLDVYNFSINKRMKK